MERMIRTMHHLTKHIRYEKVFFLAWALYNVQYILLYASELSYMFDVEGVRKFIEYTVIYIQLFLFCQLLLEYRTKRWELVKSLLFMVLITFIALPIRSKTLLIRALFILEAQPIEFKKIVRFDIKIKLPLFCLLILLAGTGIINNYQVTTNSAYKQAYGFDHPNTFTCFALCILLEILYLRFRQMNWMDWLFQIVCSLKVFQIGHGRASSYVYFGILLLFWIAKMRPRIYACRIVKFLILISTPAMGAITFLSIHLYSTGNRFMLAVNRMLTDRLLEGVQMMNQYDVNLFGHGMEFLRSRDAKLEHVKPVLLDNSYVRCLLMYGLVFFVVFIALYTLLFHRLLAGRYVSLVLYALFFVVLGYGESYLLNITYNLTLLLLLKSNREIAMNPPDSVNEHDAPWEYGDISKIASKLCYKIRFLLTESKE